MRIIPERLAPDWHFSVKKSAREVGSCSRYAFQKGSLVLVLDFVSCEILLNVAFELPQLVDVHCLVLFSLRSPMYRSPSGLTNTASNSDSPSLKFSASYPKDEGHQAELLRARRRLQIATDEVAPRNSVRPLTVPADSEAARCLPLQKSMQLGFHSRELEHSSQLSPTLVVGCDHLHHEVSIQSKQGSD